MEMIKETSKSKRNKKKTESTSSRKEYENSKILKEDDISQKSSGSIPTEESKKLLSVEHTNDVNHLQANQIEDENLKEDIQIVKINCNEDKNKIIALNSNDSPGAAIVEEMKVQNKSGEKEIAINKNINTYSTSTTSFGEQNKLEKESLCYSNLNVNETSFCKDIDKNLTKNLSESNLYPVNHLSYSKETDLTKVVAFTKVDVYPNLNNILHHEKLDNILRLHDRVLTYKEEYLNNLNREVNSMYQEFINQICGIENDPLYEVIQDYKQARKYCLEVKSKIKYLNSQLKRKKANLWFLEKKKVSEKGHCRDGSFVEGTHIFEVKVLDKELFTEVLNKLHKTEEYILSDTHFSYTEQLMKLRTEQYLYNVTRDILESISSSPVDDNSKFKKLSLLKRCISVLFAFQRLPSGDKKFLEICQRWLKILVSILHQNGDLQDHVFLLNHVIRCPNGIHNWASELVILPWFKSCKNRFKEAVNCQCLYHLLMVLHLVLQPVVFRDSFLKNLKSSCHNEDSLDGKFTFLDSDGEEEEMFELTKDWSDEDFVSLLNQISIAKMCDHILLDSKDAESRLKNPSEMRLIKLFAFANALLEVLFLGLENLSCEHFPASLEYLCSMIRHTICYISDHWNYCRGLDTVNSNLQAIFDKFFFFSVYKFFHCHKFGVWKFLASLPYENVSPKNLWQIVWIFHLSDIGLENVYNERDVERKLLEDSLTSNLLKILEERNHSDQTFFLTIYESIVVFGCPKEDLLCFIIYEIFEIIDSESSLHHLLEESINVLKCIIDKHPNMMSALVKEITKREDKSIEFSVQVFEGISIHNWVPSPEDIHHVSEWLLLSDFSMAKNQIARSLLSKMNWGFSAEGDLILPIKLHREVAILVLKAYTIYDSQGNKWSSVYRGLNQMLQYTSLKTIQNNKEFNLWAWNLLFRLKLHALDMKLPQWFQVYDGFIEVQDLPNPFEDQWLLPLLESYESKHPVACYLMLVMTTVGHKIDKLMKEGLSCLVSLIENQHYLAAIHSLYYVLPFFVKSTDELLKQSQFITSMCSLMIADITFSLNRNEEVILGAVLLEIAAMTKHQINQAAMLTVEVALPLLKLWIKVLLKLLTSPSIKTHLRDPSKQIHYLLDIIIKIAFLDSFSREYVMDLLYSMGNPLLMPSTPVNTSIWTKYFSKNPNYFTVLQRETIPNFPLLAWVVILSETNQKHLQDLWWRVQKEIYNDDKISPFSALKKSSSFLKIPIQSLEYLPIYRWTKQIIVTPVSHPLLPLMWQQFFLYYFQRLSFESSVPRCLGQYYFIQGNSLTLLKKLKESLKESVEYWLAELQKTCRVTDTELLESLSTRMECSQRGMGSKEKSYIFNVYRIFKAFSLWMSDVNLLQPNVCFSALDPKYWPERLKLIFDCEEKPWYDIISTDIIKVELEQKVRPWTAKCFSCLIGNEFKTSSEEFSHRISRHLKTVAEKPLHCDYDLEPATPEIEEVTVSSWRTLIHFIESNQNLIFENAKLFMKLAEKLKQLNFDFENLVPQEYDIFDCVIEVKKECYRGAKCTGPEKFKLNISGFNRNQRIKEKLDRNQIDHQIVQEQLINFPMDQLCSAAVHIENYIKILAYRSKNSEGKEAEKIQEMGEALFYHELEAIDKYIPTVSSFSPSRQFFSSSIEALGKEFVLGQENQLLPLAKAIVKFQNAGELASNLFLPNAAPVSILPDLYETIINAVKNGASNAAFVLLSKIHIRSILKEKNPDLTVRKRIFESICSALYACGSRPREKNLPFYEVLKNHFSVLMKWRFPDLFCNATIFFIEGMEKEEISVDVFYEVISCVGCINLSENSSLSDIKNALRKFSHNLLLPPDQQVFVTSNPINIYQVVETLKLLIERFMKKRMHQNLYEKYKNYVKPYGLYMALLNHSLPLLLMENCTITSCCTLDIWKLLSESFFPWIHPTQEAMHLNFPWPDQHIENAKYMFQIFTVSLINLNEILQEFKTDYSENCRNIMSYCWTQYVDIYVKPGFRHYSVSLCHTEYMSLPWQQFYPDSTDIEKMCTVLQSDLYESKEFLSKISLQIPWISLMKNVLASKSNEYISKILTTLGKLLIISGLNVSLTQSNAHLNKIKVLEDLPWNILSLGDVESLLILFYASYNPSITVEEDLQNNPDFYIFQFLKIICGMTATCHKTDAEIDLSKQLIFLRQYNICISQNIIVKDSPLRKLNNLQKLIPGLLSDVENIILKNVKVDKQISRALPLVREILSFLNNIPDENLEEVAVKSVIEWLKSHHASPLLLPCLQTASKCLDQIKSSVAIVECCIVTRFNTDLTGTADAKCLWDKLLSSFQLQAISRNEFIHTCVHLNSFLTLYCHVLEQMPKSCNSESRKILLLNIIDWIKRADMKDVKESDEGKCLLLWDKVLDLSILLATDGEYQTVQTALISFCHKLSLLGEDKSSRGVFGAIGFGSNSNLSVNFRFLCRLMSTFVSHQLPENSGIRLEPLAAGYKENDASKKLSHNEPWPNSHAIQSLENLRSLLKNKSYSAIKELVNGAVEFVINPEHCLLDSRKLLKNYSLLVFPKQSYLYALDC